MMRTPDTRPSLVPGALLLMLALLLPAFALADDPAFYAYKVRVQTPEQSGTPVRLALPAPLLRHSRSAMDDFLLWDEQQGEVPAIVLSEPPRQTKSEFLSFRVDHYQEEADQAVVSLQLNWPKDKAVPLYDRITLLTQAKDFRKTLTVSRVEDDGSRVALVTQGVYDFSSKVPLRKTTVQFPAQTARNLELLLANTQDVIRDEPNLSVAYRDLNLRLGAGINRKFTITGVSAQTVAQQGDGSYLDQFRISPNRVEITPEKESHISLDEVFLPVSELFLHLNNPYYHREVVVYTTKKDDKTRLIRVGQGRITKLPGMSDSDQDLSIPERFVSSLQLRIPNEDSPALQVAEVEVRFPRRHLVFVPEKGHRYTLYVGAQKRPARSYDLTRLLIGKEDPVANYLPGILGEVEENPAFDPEKATRLEAGSRAFYEHWAFTGVVALVVLLMAFWFINLVRKLPPPSNKAQG